MTRLFILADDYTGSIDTGIQFAKRGVCTTVFLYTALDEKQLASCKSQVVVVDTESRHLPAQEAAARVASATACAVAAGVEHFYKKTDSTLRGNLGAELAAMLMAADGRRLTFVPAYPALGRTTRGGVQYVGGVPLAQTEFADDPFNPIADSRVTARIAAQTDVPAYETDERSADTAFAEPCIVVADAQTDADLLRIAQTLSKQGYTRCLAGCAGFAAVLPELLQLPAAAPRACAVPDGRLLVCGSVHPRATAQCRYAVQQCGYREFALSVHQMLLPTQEKEALAGEIRACLRAGGKAVLRVGGGREYLPQTYAEARELGVAQESVPAMIAQRLGALTAAVLREAPPVTLTVFGGDTLAGVAEAMGCRSVSPVRELTDGAVLSMMTCETRTVPVITKAGAFGGEDIVARLDAAAEQRKDERK